MGRGDNLMATGLARGARDRGKRIAFGSGRIAWDKHSPEIFRGNPNIAAPGSEGDGDLEWIDFRAGNRLYNRVGPTKQHWEWNYEFKAIPGQVFFTAEEMAWAEGVGSGFILMEPNVEAWKTSAPNKAWPVERYEAVADHLAADHEIVQFVHGPGHRLRAARQVATPSFRHALAGLARASLYIGPEGGMHHGAAAVGVRGVVLFGGFVPPAVTGYDSHVNLTGGAVACGSLAPCDHCRQAMLRIGADEVVSAAKRILRRQA